MDEIAIPVQVVQDLYAAFGRGDMPAVLALIDENVDWHFNGRAEDIPFAGQRNGRNGVAEFFYMVGTTCEVEEFGPDEVMAFDDKVLSLGHGRVRARETSKVFESNWVHLFTVIDGKIVRLREFYDTAAMVEAFRPNP